MLHSSWSLDIMTGRLIWVEEQSVGGLVPKELICSTSIDLRVLLLLLKEQFINKEHHQHSSVHKGHRLSWGALGCSSQNDSLALGWWRKRRPRHGSGHLTLSLTGVANAATDWKKGEFGPIAIQGYVSWIKDLWLVGISYKLLDKPCQLRLFSALCHAVLSKWVLPIGGKHILSTVLDRKSVV